MTQPPQTDLVPESPESPEKEKPFPENFQGPSSGVNGEQSTLIPKVPQGAYQKPLAPTGTLLELVNAELRGNLDPAGVEALRSDPSAWLNVLYRALANVKDQIERKNEEMNRELASPKRSAGYEHKAKAHKSWMTRVRYFERILKKKISEVRKLVLDDDVKLILLDGITLNPTKPEDIKAWQARAEKALREQGKLQ